MSGSSQADEWLPSKLAAKKLGIGLNALIRLTDECDMLARPPRPYLRSWRPTFNRLLISGQSLAEFKRATEADPQFWEKRRRHELALRRD